MFEQASRLKLRFPYKGLCSYEDLWDMPIKDLNVIYKTLVAQRKTLGEESLLEEKTQEDNILDLQIDIIKHVYKTRVAESLEKAEDSQKRLEKKIEKQRILEALASKKGEELMKLSVTELEELAKNL